MNNQTELLSPAGDEHKLRLALEYGADAVYAGVSHFSLRIRSTKTFTYESFQESIDYTHSKGKKLYATINGFPFNAQIKLLENHIARIAEYKPDAFIVASPGVIRLCNRIAPQIPIHVSTQANVLSYMDAEVYADMGVKRIVAAREVSLKDLIKIKEHLPHIELEVFVHGSMCFAYSGRCLLSSVQSGRVSNRGSCANDCRFPYTMYAKNEDSGVLFRLEEDEMGTHIFNSKDLNMIHHVKDMLDSNVISAFKVEGRTKSPYYVAATTHAYRDALDGYYNDNFNEKKYADELNTLKNRGFTDGYIINRPYEKNDTQNHLTSMGAGTTDVHALITEDEEYFLSKGKVMPGLDYEIMSPKSSAPTEVDNEIGTIKLIDGTYFVNFKKIETQNGKTLEAVHSGNTNPCKLPDKLPKFSFLRR
ncbi:MAG: Predicted protease from collagenase family [uncultured Campylobacterales bacterium]|uniref:Predicted protease from collagenase family n=1 Tax=uncultured Campylobacterales bacterium TaxID=352960 RepID=A0A6S6T5I5_9BACT|nr:MAG: Predicted protease from collagenase family [uncultured Campylobacterales bacterium]